MIFVFLRPGKVDAFAWKTPDGVHAVVYHITVKKRMRPEVLPPLGM
jgi:hypothetical protein